MRRALSADGNCEEAQDLDRIIAQHLDDHADYDPLAAIGEQVEKGVSLASREHAADGGWLQHCNQDSKPVSNGKICFCPFGLMDHGISACAGSARQGVRWVSASKLIPKWSAVIVGCAEGLEDDWSPDLVSEQAPQTNPHHISDSGSVHPNLVEMEFISNEILELLGLTKWKD